MGIDGSSNTRGAPLWSLRRPNAAPWSRDRAVRRRQHRLRGAAVVRQRSQQGIGAGDVSRGGEAAVATALEVEAAAQDRSGFEAAAVLAPGRPDARGDDRVGEPHLALFDEHVAAAAFVRPSAHVAGDAP